MHLASSWCRRRAADLGGQLSLAAELGFQGLGMLHEEGPERGEDGLSALPAGLPGTSIAVLDERRLAAPDGSPAAPETLLAALRGLSCSRLLLHAGLDMRPELAARGQALLDRVLLGETVEAEDEALEELQRADRLPRERQLEDFLRRLSGIRRLAPGLALLVTVDPSPAGLLDLDSLRLLLAEGASLDLGYWHDCLASAQREAAGSEPAAAWLDAFAASCAGATLEDHHGGVGGQPPGTGGVDWQLLAEYLPPAAVRVLRVAPSYPGMVVEEARASLQAMRLT